MSKPKSKKLPKHLTFREGIAYFCRRVPVDLAGHPDFPKGPVRVSLGVSTVREAVPLLEVEEAKFSAKVQDVRRSLKAGPRLLDHLPTEEIHHRIASTIAVFADYAPGRSPPKPKSPADFLAAMCDIWKVEFTPRLAAQIQNAVPQVALIEEHVRHRDILPDYSAAMAAREIREVYERQQPETPPQTLVTLDEAIEQFMKEPHRLNMTSAGKRSYTPAFRILRDMFGGYRDIRSLQRRDLKEYREVLMSLPRYPERDSALRELGYRAMASVIEDRLEDDPDIETLEPSTINKYLANAARLFDFAIAETWIRQSPATKLLIPTKGAGRVAFDDDQLRRFFHPGYKLDGLLWVPLVALHQGMRANEIAQLDVDDIVEVGGTWCFRVTSWTYVNGEAKTRDDKKLKNPNAERTIPIHKGLVERGFIRYAQTRQWSGAKKLFEINKWGDSYWNAVRGMFTEMMDEAGIRTPKTKFHCFRHTWNTRLAGLQANPIHRRQLGGWSTGKDAADGVYLHQIDPRELAKTLNMLHFELPV